jgi:rhamnosyltransferase
VPDRQRSPAGPRPSANPSVCAVVVTYRPVPTSLAALLDAVLDQVGAVVVVDNASPAASLTPVTALSAEDRVVLLRQGHNVGLAAAQNAGIGWARAQGHSHVLLLDQDSIPGAGMVAGLLTELEALSRDGRVAAVGPVFRDLRESRDAPFVRVAFPMSHKLWCDATGAPIRCDFLISSGALIPLSVLAEIGGLDEALFIDNVDLEWSFRARDRGFALYGVCRTTMEHRLGDQRVPVLAGRATVVTHGPVRLYYIMRNRLDLYRRPYTPRVWIAQDIPRVAAKFVIFSVLVGPRLRNVRFMLRGLADGLRGRLGPCPLVSAP